jgi:acyl dehydratase
MTEVLRRCFDQRDLIDFGALSGGDGRIHTDPEYAAGTRYGHTLVQGMLISALMEHAAATANPGRRLDARFDITFVAPVGPGTEIVIRQIDRGDRPRFEALTDAGVVAAATLSPSEQV